MINQYRRIMVSHPVTGERIQILEHVYLWLLATGEWLQGEIALPKGYCLHHKDQIKSNNDLANLEMLTFGEHIQKHYDMDKDRRRKQSESLKRFYSAQTPEQKAVRVSAAQKASVEKVKRDGPTEKQLAGLARARSFSYGGTRRPVILTPENIEEIQRLYIPGRDVSNRGNGQELADRFGIKKKQVIRIAKRSL